MKPFPKTVAELEANKHGRFSGNMEVMIEFVKKRWKGFGHLKPKRYKEFIEDYTDYKGMGGDEDDCRIAAAENEYNGFNDETATSFSFPTKVDIAHVAYDDICQGRDPAHTLLSAFMAHGHARGVLYGKKAAMDYFSNHLSYVMVCKILPKLKKNASKKTIEALDDFRSTVALFVIEMAEGKHDYDCKCDMCHIDMTPKKKRKVNGKSKRVAVRKSSEKK